MSPNEFESNLKDSLDNLSEEDVIKIKSELRHTSLLSIGKNFLYEQGLYNAIIYTLDKLRKNKEKNFILNFTIIERKDDWMSVFPLINVNGTYSVHCYINEKDLCAGTLGALSSNESFTDISEALPILVEFLSNELNLTYKKKDDLTYFFNLV